MKMRIIKTSYGFKYPAAVVGLLVNLAIEI